MAKARENVRNAGGTCEVASTLATPVFIPIVRE